LVAARLNSRSLKLKPVLRVITPGANLEVTDMYKSLAGIAAAAVLTVVAVPSAPANAAPIQNVAGIAEHQSGVEQVQYRRYRHGYRRGYWRGPAYRSGYGASPYYYGAAPYAYAAPYPYYRRHYYYGGPAVRVGPFGFGVW